MSIILIILVTLLQCNLVQAQPETLKERINKIIGDKNAKVGISIVYSDGKETININGEDKFPMQSVFKFHIALAVLAEVDKGNLSLEQAIEIKKSDMLPDTWSPIRDAYPGGAMLTLGEIIKYTVAISDNVGCDVLLRLTGGPKAVTEFMESKGLTGFSIVYNEEEMQRNWENQFSNFSTPVSATDLLRLFLENKIVSEKSTAFLKEIMIQTSTGMKRLKGKLPGGTVVAHKTGTSGRNKEGISAATNDIGIVWLPDGSRFYICVFVTDSKESDEVNERIIAEVAKAAYDYYLQIK